MRLFLAIFVLATVLTFGNASADQETELVSEGFCVVPVNNGRPTEADHGAVFRMVSSVDVIPHLGQVYIQPGSRGGRWTIDRDGAFVPFEGPFPTRGLSTQRQWIVDGSGRVVGVNPRSLFVIDPPNDTFRKVLQLDDFEYFGKLKYEPDTDTIFVKTSKGLHELRGETLVRSPLAVEAAELGLTQLQPPHFISSIGAHLIEARDGEIALRFADGIWRIVHTLRCGRCWTDAKVFDLPSEQLIVVRTRREIFALDVKDPRNPRFIDLYWKEKTPIRGRIDYSRETDTFLISSDELFLRLSEDAAVPSVRPGDSRLLRITRQGVHPVPGQEIVPKKSGDSTKYRSLGRRFRDLPGRGQVLVRAPDKLALFDGERVWPIPNSGPSRLGAILWVFALQALDRVLIASSVGLYELTRDNELVWVETPFDQSGYPVLRFFDAPHLNVAIVLTKEGVYTLDKDGAFRRVPGGEDFKEGAASDKFVVLPKTGDVLIAGLKALHLIRRAPCDP